LSSFIGAGEAYSRQADSVKMMPEIPDFYKWGLTNSNYSVREVLSMPTTAEIFSRDTPNLRAASARSAT